MLKVKLNIIKSTRISVFLSFLLFLVSNNLQAAPLFGCYDQFGKHASWSGDVCICSFADGSFKSSGERACNEEKGDYSCPCSAGQSFAECVNNICDIALLKFNEIPETENQPPPCKSGCYDHGVILNRDESRIWNDCSYSLRRVCKGTAPTPTVKPTNSTIPTRTPISIKSPTSGPTVLPTVKVTSSPLR